MEERNKIGKLSEKIKDAYYVSLAAVTIYLGSALPVLAESELSEKVEQGLKSIYGDIYAIIIPLYALVVLIGCARIFFANGRKAEGILDWIKRATIAFIAIMATLWIIQLIQNLTKGGQYNF